MVQSVFQRYASIIMPVHSDPSYGVKSAVITRVATRYSWAVLLPKYNPDNPRFDIDQALRALSQVSLVVADLSRERPSTYFELGLVEALRIPVRVIAELGTEIHQTSHRDNIRFYAGLDGLDTELSAIFATKE